MKNLPILGRKSREISREQKREGKGSKETKNQRIIGKWKIWSFEVELAKTRERERES